MGEHAKGVYEVSHSPLLIIYIGCCRTDDNYLNVGPDSRREQRRSKLFHSHCTHLDNLYSPFSPASGPEASIPITGTGNPESFAQVSCITALGQNLGISRRGLEDAHHAMPTMALMTESTCIVGNFRSPLTIESQVGHGRLTASDPPAIVRLWALGSGDAQWRRLKVLC